MVGATVIAIKLVPVLRALLLGGKCTASGCVYNRLAN